MKEFQNIKVEEDPTEGEILSNPADLSPKIASKPGWKTSQGQMTAVFVVVAMIFAAFGYKNMTVDKMQSIYDAVLIIVTTVGPIFVAGWNLIRYTDSRGKQASNTIWANAAIQAPQMVEELQTFGEQSQGPVPLKWSKILKGARIGTQIGSAIAPAVVPNKRVQEVIGTADEILGIVDLITGKFHKIKKEDED